MTGKTLLIGSGTCARRIADDLAIKGMDLIIASSGEDFDGWLASAATLKTKKRTKVYTKTRVVSCRGAVGNFEVTLDANGVARMAAVEQIIIAEEEKRIPCFSGYGLTRTDTVMSISQLKKLLSEPCEDPGQLSGINSVVFLVGLNAESNTVISEEIMKACLKLQADYKPKTYILTRNLKVAANGLEKMYRETKAAGVEYLKFIDTTPDISQAEDGRVQFEFTDEITDNNLRLTADLTIVDEQIAPCDYTNDLINLFELDGDLNGFAQGDNVHRLTVFTNRKGILAAGPTRSVQSISDKRIDADNAVLSLLGGKGPNEGQVEDKAHVDSGKCVRCLTCYRLCPYRAIQVNTRVSVTPDACESCGICVAECPRGAISMGDHEPMIVNVSSAGAVPQLAEDIFIPSILALCCSRSAAQAAELAALMAPTLPRGLRVIEVPCGGSISLSYILAALESDADGVMVLTCHRGNCHSVQGNIYAQQRVDQLNEMLTSIGLENGRLIQKTLASNMGMEFADALAEFEKQLMAMGPSRLKKDNQ